MMVCSFVFGLYDKFVKLFNFMICVFEMDVLIFMLEVLDGIMVCDVDCVFWVFLLVDKLFMVLLIWWVEDVDV